MKPFNFSRFLPSGGFFLMLCAVMFMAATHPPPSWQPPITDTSLRGNGTNEDALGVSAPIVYAGRITQASTSAPTALELYNDIDAAGFTYTRDSIGTYKIEGSDAAFLDSTLTFNFTLGNSAVTAIGSRVYRVSDSILIIKILKSNGYGVDLAGTASLEIIDPNPG